VDRSIHRKSDPLNISFNKSSRIVNNSRGYFYKVRGGKYYGPFDSLSEAESDLTTFINVIKIEDELDPHKFLNQS
jgi:hypothetical protein